MLKKTFTPATILITLGAVLGTSLVLYAWRLPPFASSVEMTDNAYVRGDVTSLAAKVAWISPLTSRFLLVNRRGMRVLVASAEELAALAQAGRLVVGAESTPSDEAMRQVRNRLGRNAA